MYIAKVGEHGRVALSIKPHINWNIRLTLAALYLLLSLQLPQNIGCTIYSQHKNCSCKQTANIKIQYFVKMKTQNICLQHLFLTDIFLDLVLYLVSRIFTQYKYTRMGNTVNK